MKWFQISNPHPHAGVMLWELLHGQTAFERLLAVAPHVGDPSSTDHVRGFERPDAVFVFTSDWGLPEYAELCKHCLAVDPVLRPSFDEIVAVICGLVSRQFLRSAQEHEASSGAGRGGAAAGGTSITAAAGDALLPAAEAARALGLITGLGPSDSFSYRSSAALLGRSSQGEL